MPAPNIVDRMKDIAKIRDKEKIERLEKKIKEVMKYFAKEIRGEWYNTPLEFAKSRLEEALESYNNGEWDERIIS